MRNTFNGLGKTVREIDPNRTMVDGLRDYIIFTEQAFHQAGNDFLTHVLEKKWRLVSSGELAI